MSGELLMVVDNNPVNLKLISTLLKNSGYEVCTAQNDQEALAMLRQEPASLPDLILCTKSTAQKHEEQLVPTLRTRPDFDDVPIIIIIENADYPLRIQSLRAGALDYLVKPIDRQELQVRVANLLKMRQVRQILQRDARAQSHDVVTLAKAVALQLQNQANQLEKRNRKLKHSLKERDQAEARMLWLASIVESSSEAIYSKTLEDIITSWNGSAEKLYERTAVEMIGNSTSLIMPLDRQNELIEATRQIKAGEALVGIETARVRKDGTFSEMSLIISPIKDARGNIVGTSTLSHDITEQKRLIKELGHLNTDISHQRDELITVNAALEKANQARSLFLSTMSHELRTPLASIIGFAELLLEDVKATTFDQTQYHNLERILKNGQHLLNLINDVLDLSKVEAGRMDVPYSQIDVRELLTSVVEETQSIAIEQHLNLRVEVEEGIDHLESNQMRVHQILLNLVSNALKFTHQGEVIISAHKVSNPNMHEDSIALAVKDTGIGIPVELQGHIFEAFYQVSEGYTRKVGGTGLGLSIVKQLTNLLGGKIELVSIPGQGSTFTVTLPLKATHQSI